jgi:hypothetical protein
MWRREEKLAFWLARGRPSNEPSLVERLKKKLQFRFGLFPLSVKEEYLPLETRTQGGEEALEIDTPIRDGLSNIYEWTEDKRGEPSLNQYSGRALSVELLDVAQIQNLKLPDRREAPILQGNLVIQTVCRSLSIDFVLKGTVRELGNLFGVLPKIIDRKFSLIEKAPIGNILSFVEMVPYKRTSLKIEELSDSECESFCREAEAIKGIPVNCAELLAVFRHVPIEMISKMRYLADNKIILYTLCRGMKRTHTRVHDIAAIRDTVSQAVVLVPHRTRFRSVYLNNNL